MENHQYQQNNKLFVLGITCLSISLGLIFFSLYITPYLIWELKYDVPEFIINQIVFFQDSYSMTSFKSKMLVWLLYFVPGLLSGILAYYCSKKMDENVIYEKVIVQPKENEHTVLKESASICGKIIVLMAIIVIAIFLLQEFIYMTARQS